MFDEEVEEELERLKEQDAKGELDRPADEQQHYTVEYPPITSEINRGFDHLSVERTNEIIKDAEYAIQAWAEDYGYTFESDPSIVSDGHIDGIGYTEITVSDNDTDVLNGKISTNAYYSNGLPDHTRGVEAKFDYERESSLHKDEYVEVSALINYWISEEVLNQSTTDKALERTLGRLSRFFMADY